MIDSAGNIYLGSADASGVMGQVIIIRPGQDEPEIVPTGIPMTFVTDATGDRVLAYVKANDYVGVVDLADPTVAVGDTRPALGPDIVASLVVGDDGAVYRLNLTPYGPPQHRHGRDQCGGGDRDPPRRLRH